MNSYDFHERLQFSRGVAEETHPETIKKLLIGCVKVDKATVELDRVGIDFIGTLRGGATVNIDLKMRAKGCSSHWRKRSVLEDAATPQLALEKWSKYPESGRTGVVGWTLDESKLTDYTLHVFDPSDTLEVFLLPFQLLRMAFRTNVEHWWGLYRSAIQDSGGWKSQCLFVPADVVIDAIQTHMRFLLAAKEYADATPEDGPPAREVISKRNGTTPAFPGVDWGAPPWLA